MQSAGLRTLLASEAFPCVAMESVAMNDVTLFFEVFPSIDTVHDLNIAIMANAGIRGGVYADLGDCFSDDAIKFGLGSATCTARELVARARRAVNAAISKVPDQCLKSFSEAIETYERASQASHYKAVHDKLGELAVELDELIDRLAIAAFGYWGAHLFRVLLEQKDGRNDERIFRREPKRRAFPDDGEEPATLLADLAVLLPKESSVRVDDASRSVVIGNRPSCRLNRTSYSLLKALWQARNEYVSLDELSTAMGRNGTDADVKRMPARKKRLVDELKVGGYPDLAACIETMVGHYALRFTSSPNQSPSSS